MKTPAIKIEARIIAATITGSFLIEVGEVGGAGG
jgi:hypothetical protein